MPENPHLPRIRGYTTRLETGIRRAFTAVRETLGNEIDQSQTPVRPVVWDENDWALAIDEHITPVVEDVLHDSFQYWLDEWGFQAWPSAEPEAVDATFDALAQQTLERINGYSRYITRDVDTSVARHNFDKDLLKESLGLVAVGGSLYDTREKPLAEETATYLFWGSSSFISNALNFAPDKTWYCSFANSRIHHEDANGQLRRGSETFDVGGETLSWPGDGSAHNSVNCNCWLEYVYLEPQREIVIAGLVQTEEEAGILLEVDDVADLSDIEGVGDFFPFEFTVTPARKIWETSIRTRTNQPWLKLGFDTSREVCPMEAPKMSDTFVLDQVTTSTSNTTPAPAQQVAASTTITVADPQQSMIEAAIAPAPEVHIHFGESTTGVDSVPRWVPLGEENANRRATLRVGDIAPIEAASTEESDFASNAPEGAEWTGILIVEGIESGDGRKIAEGALTWRDLPLPLMLQTENQPGHQGSIIAGSIIAVERVGQDICAYGKFDSGEAGVEARRLLGEGTMRGVSADIDMVEIEWEIPESDIPEGDVSEDDLYDLLFDDRAVMVLTEGRIMGATLTPFPAFQEAMVEVLPGAEASALVASGGRTPSFVWRQHGSTTFTAPGEAPKALVASGRKSELTKDIPEVPPMAWFEQQKNDQAYPVKIEMNGEIHGYAAAWGSCHIGIADHCEPVPASMCSYAQFRTGNTQVRAAEGDKLVATGPVFMDTYHPDLYMNASDAFAHYADTGAAVADITVYEDEHGIQVRGAVRPGISGQQLRALRGADFSPDWRPDQYGNLECVAMLAVNCSGFITKGLVASAGRARGAYNVKEGRVTGLVAAGMLRKPTHQFDQVKDQVGALASVVKTLTDESLQRRLDAQAEEVLATFEGIEVPVVEKEEPNVDDVQALIAAATAEVFGSEESSEESEDGAVVAGSIEFNLSVDQLPEDVQHSLAADMLRAAGFGETITLTASAESQTGCGCKVAHDS